MTLDTTIDAQSPAQQFVAPLRTNDDVPDAQIYPMIMQGLRDLDQQQGQLFLQRFLQRPSELWARWLQDAWRLPQLLDAASTPLQALQHLRSIVGFGPGTGQPDAVASRLDELHLRRLIKLAVPFWQKRGLREALVDALRALCGVRPAIYDWHWLEALAGDASVGEQGLPGVDLTLLYNALQSTAWNGSPVILVPDGVADGPGQVWIRVADLTGALDRQLVMDICQLARPAGERYEVAFVDFADGFLDGRLSHWHSLSGTVSAVSATGDSTTDPPTLPGMEVLENCAETVVLPNSLLWTDCLVSVVVRTFAAAQSYRFYFLFAGVLGGDGYFLEIQQNIHSVRLGSTVGGATNYISGGAIADLQLFTPGLRTLRIVCKHEGAEQLVRAYLDGVKVIDYVGAFAIASGTLAVEVTAGAGKAIRFSSFELFQQPLDVRVLTP